MEVVYVEWLDSRSVTYLSAASARKEGLLLMSTAGLLIGEDDQVLRLALDFWSFDDDGDYAERYRYVAIIPKAAIQRRQQWDVIPPLVQNPDSDPKLAASWSRNSVVNLDIASVICAPPRSLPPNPQHSPYVAET